jgi:hypothetical protein
MKAEAKKPYEKAWMNRVEIAREWVAVRLIYMLMLLFLFLHTLDGGGTTHSY